MDFHLLDFKSRLVKQTDQTQSTVKNVAGKLTESMSKLREYEVNNKTLIKVQEVYYVFVLKNDPEIYINSISFVNEIMKSFQ